MANGLRGRPVQNNAQRAVESFHTEDEPPNYISFSSGCARVFQTRKYARKPTHQPIAVEPIRRATKRWDNKALLMSTVCHRGFDVSAFAYEGNRVGVEGYGSFEFLQNMRRTSAPERATSFGGGVPLDALHAQIGPNLTRRSNKHAARSNKHPKESRRSEQINVADAGVI
jgi:hypothetical protein